MTDFQLPGELCRLLRRLDEIGKGVIDASKSAAVSPAVLSSKQGSPNFHWKKFPLPTSRSLPAFTKTDIGLGSACVCEVAMAGPSASQKEHTMARVFMRH
jgi:hypothetical protein